VNDFNAVKALGGITGSTRTEEQTALAPFWEGNASVHWNQAANQIARAHRLSISRANRLLAVLNIAMADTALTIWSAKRFYGEDAAAVTWRPITAITQAATDGQPGDRSRRCLGTSRHYAVSPGISCRASQSQRGGREHSSRALQRPTNIQAHDTQTAGPHVYEHQAGAR
jgi:hypothetical protein